MTDQRANDATELRAPRRPHAPLSEPGPSVRRFVGLLLGPAIGLLVYAVLAAIPATADALSHSGRCVAGAGALMAVLWITEALPVAVTALLPILLFPLLTGGEVSARSASAPYAHELIFLFLGGFLLAQAMQTSGLHRRIALTMILLVGTEPARLVAGFMLAAAFLSMWVSNTATVVMMFPIAVSVIGLMHREDSGPTGRPSTTPVSSHFAICLLLGTAYGSSIGGIGTPIGTPPNALLIAFLQRQYGIEVSFVRWMGVGIPLVVVFLPATWLLLTRVIFPLDTARSATDGGAIIHEEMNSQGPMTRAQRRVLIVFIATACAWITRPVLAGLTVPGGGRPLAGLSDAGIAMAAAISLFIIPGGSSPRTPLLTWEAARNLPWGILVLFGGGLSLAASLEQTGVSACIARAAGGLEGVPAPVLVLIVTSSIVFLTELTSNTATTATFLPILGAVAVGLGISPVLLLVPTAIGASCAFMMPVATPPNAVVFSSGRITVPHMCKAGVWLNVIGIALVVGLMYTAGGWVLGIQPP